MVKKTSSEHEWTKGERKLLRGMNSPAKIQAYLDRIPYHLADTAWSPRSVMEGRSAHCLEGAIFAAAALRFNGFPALILDLEADNDTDHVIAVYQQGGAWGAIASSNYATCRFRSPIYRNPRELALSYFEGYFNLRRQRTLRRFSNPVNLERFDRRHWMTTREPVWFIAEHLLDIPHKKLITPAMAKNLVTVDKRSYFSGIHGKRS